MQRYGSLDFADGWGDAVATAAYAAFEQAFRDVPDSEHLQFLEQLIPYMLERAS